jgi:hypothetical protein
MKSPEGPRFPSSYRRLWTFSDDARLLGDRVMMIDIDAVVTGDLGPLFAPDDDFVGWVPSSIFWHPANHRGKSMQTLQDELRQTIERRVRQASADEMTRIILALMMEDEIDLSADERGDTATDRFELAHRDQVVIDQMTGLMWSRAELATDRLKWPDADSLCRNLELAGFDDWRMPTVDELFALADRTRSDPAIDTRFFPDCKPNWYWSSTPYAPSPGDYAWSVLFSGGSAAWCYRDGLGFVRAVRASQ